MPPTCNPGVKFPSSEGSIGCLNAAFSQQISQNLVYEWSQHLTALKFWEGQISTDCRSRLPKDLTCLGTVFFVDVDKLMKLNK